MRNLTAQALTATAFAAFGQVVEGENVSGPERREFMANWVNDRNHARVNVTFMRVPLPDGPVHVKALERHAFSNQIFVPLEGTHHLVAVCQANADGSPDPDTLEVFVANGGQAVNYAPHVWHAPRQPLTHPGTFVMIRHDDGSELDTEAIPLAEPLNIVFSAELLDTDSR